MTQDETRDPEDIDSIDPEDDEVEVEEDDLDDFTPEPIVSVTLDDPESLLSSVPEETETVPEEEGDPSADPLDGDVNELGLDETPFSGPLGSYRITGLVDYTDEQGNIIGQLPKDSIQEVPVELGDAWVEAGQAEKV